MQTADKFKELRGTQYEGGAVFTEGELYLLQAATLCAQDYWKKTLQECQGQGNAMEALAKDQVRTHEGMHKQITQLLEGA